jgi:hypothetical protein
MLADSNSQRQQELMLAMIKLNMDGVQSAIDVAFDPGLQNPSVARIRDRVDGLTAEEFIELAGQVQDIEISLK